MAHEDSEEKIKQNLHNQLKTHRKYLKAEQVEILENLYKRNIFEYTYKTPNGGEFEAKGLLTFDDLEKLINQEMAFEKLNIKFDYWK